MKQRLLTSQDIVQSVETQNRFGIKTTINPLNITRNCGLLKDYKTLKNINDLFIEFDGINTRYDVGKGIFKRIDNQVLQEDFGIIIKVGNHFYQRQYEGYVLFDWFNSDSLDILLLALQKYTYIKLSKKKYIFNIQKPYNAQVTKNFYIDGNQAEIEFISNEKLESIFKLYFNTPIDYAIFTNCKIKFNATTFVTALRQVNCKTFDFYTENKFVDIDSKNISLTGGYIIDGMPANIQAQKTFYTTLQKKEATTPKDTEFLCLKDLESLGFLVNYVYAYNRQEQNIRGQKSFKECYLPLAKNNTEYCNMQNLQDIIEYEMEEQLRQYTLNRAKEIGLEVSGNFPEGAVYLQISNNGEFLEQEAPKALFGENDGIAWTDLTDYINTKLKQGNIATSFYLRKNKNRDNDALYCGGKKIQDLAINQSLNAKPNDLNIPNISEAKQAYKLWYKGDCTKLKLVMEA